MKTPNERLDDLDQRIAILERTRLTAVSAAYGAVLAALQSLKDNRVIQGVHVRSAKAAMEQSFKESFATQPELLDALRYGHFDEPWR